MTSIRFDSLFPVPTVLCLVGLPGSGKSTIAKELQEKYPNTMSFSSDEYREKICGNANDQTKNDKVFNAMYADAIAAILVGKNIIIDATNINRKDRKHVLEKFSKYACHKVAYFIDTNFRTCIDRDAERSRSVGKHVIEKFLRRFEFPQKFEGFDEIYIHSKINKSMNDDFNREKERFYLEEMDNFDQKNPHHIHTVGGHCSKLAMQIPRTSHINCIMHEAGWWHDIGKLYTQKIDENGIAHYYNHDNIGAYIIACNPEILYNMKNWEDVYEVIFFINYHMRAHNDFTHAKAERKYRALFGDDRFNNLMRFGQYDRIASGTYNLSEEN